MSNECKKIDDQNIKNGTKIYGKELQLTSDKIFEPFTTICFVEPQNCTFCNK